MKEIISRNERSTKQRYSGDDQTARLKVGSLRKCKREWRQNLTRLMEGEETA